MVREIVKGVAIFKKAEEATKDDLNIAKDLRDTLNANRDICVGMAANMIGSNKRIIAFMTPTGAFVMINPKIVKKFGGKYDTEEGCLSLLGVRKTKRYNEICVEYSSIAFEKHKADFKGYTAQIIQHEIDHCDGIMI